MCGIVGAFSFGKFAKKTEETVRRESQIFITTELLQQTVERGKDATGVALLFEDGNYQGLKMGIESTDFITRFGETEKDFKGMLKIWREYPKRSKVYLGHCRKSSVGNSYDNRNNHPVQVGNIVLIHNGTLKNHDIIFEKLGCDRTGEVDSEAIARLLHHYSNGGTEPFTMEMLKEVTNRLEGSYSVLAISGNNPYQVAQFRDFKPAQLLLVRPLKTVFVASEKKYLETALYEYVKTSQLLDPSMKFPLLGKDDLEFDDIKDDSHAIWDLTKDIGPETKLADLYTAAKNTVTTQRIWKSTTTGSTSTYAGGSYNYNQNTRHNTGAGATKKTEVTATSKSSSSSSNKDDDEESGAAGLVWSKSLNKYKNQSGIDKTKAYGSVEIDSETGSITPISNVSGGKGPSDEGLADLKRVTVKEVESLVSSPAKVEEIAVSNIKTALNQLDSSASEKNSSGPGERTKGSARAGSEPVKVKEIDMTVDAEAMSAAEEFVDRGLTKFEDEDEVLDALDITDRSVLKNLPAFALANRIVRKVAKKFFYVGYRARKIQEGSSDRTKDDKHARAEKTIRSLKLATRILISIAEKVDSKDMPDVAKAALKSVINDKSSLSAQDVLKAFSEGECKKSQALKAIKEAIK